MELLGLAAQEGRAGQLAQQGQLDPLDPLDPQDRRAPEVRRDRLARTLTAQQMLRGFQQELEWEHHHED